MDSRSAHIPKIRGCPPGGTCTCTRISRAGWLVTLAGRLGTRKDPPAGGAAGLSIVPMPCQHAGALGIRPRGSLLLLLLLLKSGTYLCTYLTLEASRAHQSGRPRALSSNRRPESLSPLLQSLSADLQHAPVPDGHPPSWNLPRAGSERLVTLPHEKRRGCPFFTCQLCKCSANHAGPEKETDGASACKQAWMAFSPGTPATAGAGKDPGLARFYSQRSGVWILTRWTEQHQPVQGEYCCDIGLARGPLHVDQFARYLKVT